jgi:predicted nucleotidyltransferase
MEIRGKTIGGLNAVQVRDALRAFLDLKTPMSLENGKFKIERKILKSDFLAKKLSLSNDDGTAFLATLVNEGYIDKDKLIPTTLGMALAQAEDRERLPLSQARECLGEFLEAVKTVNARHGARILIERVHVFGSYLAEAETVGDIDLLIEAPLPDDCEPEDMDEYDRVMHEIKISDYLSFHDEYDMVVAEADKRLVYDRKNPI